MIHRRRALLPGALTLAVSGALLATTEAFACPVCGTAKTEASRQAFVGSTVFLSLLPLVLIGALVGFGFWRARSKRSSPSQADFEARASSVLPRARSGGISTQHAAFSERLNVASANILRVLRPAKQAATRKVSEGQLET